MEYQAEDGVITFAQIWRVIKKSFARAVIYVVVCAVLCFALLFTVRTVTAENTYSAKITFKQSDATIKTTLDGYMATAVNNAIGDVFSSSDDTTEIYQTVLETLTITAYIPDENTDDSTYIATTYTVSFEDLDLKGVSKNQQISLLADICTELISYYSEVNSTDLLLSSLVWGYTANYTVEYLDIINELETRLSTLKTSMSANIDANVALNSKFATYKSSDTSSNRRTAYEILAQIDNIEYTVSSLRQNVYNNAVVNTNATINGETYCIAKKASLSNEYAELEAVAAVYEAQLANLGNVIGNVGTSGTDSLLSVDITAYTELIEKLVEVNTQMASIKTQISEVETLQTNLANFDSTANAASMASTEATINEVTSAVSTLIEEYNDLVNEFEDQVVPSTYASVSKSAYYYNDSVISWSLLFIAVVGVAVIAYVVAFGQTWSNLKKAGTLNGDRKAKQTNN